MFGRIVMDVKGERFDHALDAAKAAHGATQDTDLDAAALRELVDEFKAIVRADTGRDFPSDPYEQLDLAIKAVFASAGSASAPSTTATTRRSPTTSGTAVNVVTMVFGNMGDDSGTGVAFTRDPNTGEKVLYGEYLTNAQGEDVVAGIRTAPKISQMRPTCRRSTPSSSGSASSSRSTTATSRTSSSRSSAASCTCSRRARAKRTAAAAVKIAVDMVDEGIITKEEALAPDRAGPRRPAPARPVRPGRRSPAPTASPRASTPRPGAAVGRAVFDADTAVEWVGRGERVVLVRVETSPDDFHGMAVAAGHPDRPRRRDLARGGRRPPDRQAVRRRLRRARRRLRDEDAPTATTSDVAFAEGDWISVDGATGAGLRRRAADRRRRGSRTSRSSRRSSAGPTRSAGWRSGPTPTSPRRPPRRAATAPQGIGLCRTEHMFREGERLEIVRGAILVANVGDPGQGEGRRRRDARRRRGRRPSPRFDAAMAKLEVLQQGDFEGIFRAMDGLPVVIRLIDPPLHEFLPNLEEQLVKVTRAEMTGGATEEDKELLATIKTHARAEPDARPARLPARA